MMNQKNRFLAAILVMLSLSVLVTGGLAVYLTLTREDEDGETSDVTAAPTVTESASSAPRIAFASDREGDAAIYAMDTDGSNAQRVSSLDQGFCVFPSWSSDGQRVAYVGAEERPSEEDEITARVWVSAADGSEHAPVSHAMRIPFSILATSLDSKNLGLSIDVFVI